MPPLGDISPVLLALVASRIWYRMLGRKVEVWVGGEITVVVGGERKQLQLGRMPICADLCVPGE